MTARPIVLAALAEIFAEADDMTDATPLDSEDDGAGCHRGHFLVPYSFTPNSTCS